MQLLLMKSKATSAAAGEDTSSFFPSLFSLSRMASPFSEKQGVAVSADGETSGRLSQGYLQDNASSCFHQHTGTAKTSAWRERSDGMFCTFSGSKGCSACFAGWFVARDSQGRMKNSSSSPALLWHNAAKGFQVAVPVIQSPVFSASTIASPFP